MIESPNTNKVFLEYCGAVAAAMGVSSSMVPRIAEALTSDSRPPVVWFQLADCTGCKREFFRESDPGVEEILFDALKLRRSGGCTY